MQIWLQNKIVIVDSTCIHVAHRGYENKEDGPDLHKTKQDIFLSIFFSKQTLWNSSSMIYDLQMETS